MPPPLIFRYKIYKGLESPIIPIGLKSAIGWRKVWGYIDSGSIYFTGGRGPEAKDCD